MTARHDGDAGDAIYSLPCVRAFAREHGPIRLALSPCIRDHPHGGRHFYPDRAPWLLPLLRAQPSDWRTEPGGAGQGRHSNSHPSNVGPSGTLQQATTSGGPPARGDDTHSGDLGDLTGFRPAGRPTGSASAAGAYTLGYDDADRVSSVAEPFGLVLTFGYDADGNRTRVQDSKGGVTTSTYDAAGRLESRRLFRSPDNAGDHRLHTAAEARPAVDVEAITVDALFAGRPGGVDFVKVDVQGSEGAALDGMAGVLSRSPRVTMLVEFCPQLLEEAGYGAARLLSRLGSLGFRVYEADEADLSVRRADPRDLLARFPATSDAFTNLWCVKAPLPTPPAAVRTGQA